MRRMDGYIALGSNLGDRRWPPGGRAGRIARAPGSGPSAISSVWETEPVDTPFPALVLEHGGQVTHRARARWTCWTRCWRSSARRAARGTSRNGPRTLDLDLLHGGRPRRSMSERLRLPHPRMWQRASSGAAGRDRAGPAQPAHRANRSRGATTGFVGRGRRCGRLGDLASCAKPPLIIRPAGRSTPTT